MFKLNDNPDKSSQGAYCVSVYELSTPNWTLSGGMFSYTVYKESTPWEHIVMLSVGLMFFLTQKQMHTHFFQ